MQIVGALHPLSIGTAKYVSNNLSVICGGKVPSVFALSIVLDVEFGVVQHQLNGLVDFELFSHN